MIEDQPVGIDLIGEYTITGDSEERKNEAATEEKGLCLVQVKYLDNRLSKPQLEEYLARVDELIVQEYSRPTYAAVGQWFFCKSGYSQPTKDVLQSKDILHSDRARFNNLA